MKKFLIVTAALFLAVSSLFAQQSIFDVPSVSEYSITESVSLGNALTTTGGQVTGTVSGKISGKLVINTKANFLKIAGRTISYVPDQMKRKEVLNSVLYSGTGLWDGNKVTFQVIEDYANNTVNIIAEWPDHSASRVQGSLTRRR